MNSICVKSNQRDYGRTRNGRENMLQLCFVKQTIVNRKIQQNLTKLLSKGYYSRMIQGRSPCQTSLKDLFSIFSCDSDVLMIASFDRARLMNPGQLGLGSSRPGSARPGQLGRVNSALYISIIIVMVKASGTDMRQHLYIYRGYLLF